MALSSGEAELYALNKGAQEGLGVRQMTLELGWGLDLVCFTDASAARGAVHRTGAGRLKHVKVQEFWLQQALRENRLTVENTTRPECGRSLHSLVGNEILSAIFPNGIEQRGQ